jgi:hypothetical protein
MLINSKIYKNIFLIFIVFYACACAVQQPLTGGQKDEQPPRLDSLRSDKNNVVDFKAKTLEFFYDEWIELENPPKVTVSPPLREKPTIKNTGKSVTFEFGKKEILRENATYKIDFGESIKDLNEGNKAILKYVFSTGRQIDTLKMTAQVTDALTQKPVENALFMLYDDFVDSIVVKDVPFYYAKTDKTGFATIENIKAGKFKAFALLEDNQNFKYDLATEKIAFLTQSIDSQDTTKNKIYNFSLSVAPRKLQILEKSTANFGLVKLVLPVAAEQVAVNWEDKNQRVMRENDGDTLKIWYANAVADNWKIFVFDDTVAVKPLVKEDFLKKNKFFPTNIPFFPKGSRNATPTTVTINPFQPYQVLWNVPLSKIEASKILIEEDSTKLPIDFLAKIDSSVARKLVIEARFKEDKRYNITLLPDAAIDIFDRKNDTLRTQVSLDKKKNFGDVVVNFKNIDPKSQYLIEVLDEGDKVKQAKILTSKDRPSLTFFHLPLAKYSIRIITDTNKNNRWDAADYFKKQAAETIFIKPLETLQDGFDTNVDIDFSNQK